MDENRALAADPKRRSGPRIAVAILLCLVLSGAMVVLFAKREGRSGPPPVKASFASGTRELRGFPRKFCEHQTTSARGTAPYVLTLAGGSKAESSRAATACGAQVIGPLPPNALLVETSASALCRLSADGHFTAAAEWSPDDKIAPGLKALVDASGAAPDAPLEVTVVSLAATDLEEIVARVEANGGRRLEGCPATRTSVRMAMDAQAVRKLAKLGCVRWLEPFARPKLLNDRAVTPVAMNVQPIWERHGLTGAGQIISTSDSGIDTGDIATLHLDLRNRICGMQTASWKCLTYDRNGHGTHTAGSLVGDGTLSDGAIRGVAYGARLWVWACLTSGEELLLPESYDELFRPDQENFPTYIHSASWGTEFHGAYTTQCREIDEYVWEHPDFLPVFANGNEGPTARTVNTPAAAKNVLSVGATQNARTGHDKGRENGNPAKTADFSSRGPCKDGRIKPDLCAPGAGILSTRSGRGIELTDVAENTNYVYCSGTSMATPLTAGAAALVREWLVDRRGFTNTPPSAALMKAVLTGGARDASVPDNDRGWGRLDLGETLYPSNRAVMLVDQIPFSHGSAFRFDVTLTNAAPFDVQLVWIDRPATEGASVAIVNDLDLVVSNRETGAVWFGNGTADGDRLNTVESVRVASAAPGTYAVLVRGADVLYDSTVGGAAALYLRGAFESTDDPVQTSLKIASVSPPEPNVALEVGGEQAFSVSVETNGISGIGFQWTWDGEPCGSDVDHLVCTAAFKDRGLHRLRVVACDDGGRTASVDWNVLVRGELAVSASAGDDQTATGEADRPFATLQTALERSLEGETLHVAPGTYSGPVETPDHKVSIVSAAGASKTMIDGLGICRCFSDYANCGSVLVGFTLTNGFTSARFSWESDPGAGAYGGVLVDCLIRDCHATGNYGCGGGAYLSTLTNCTVENCSAGWYGGGVAMSMLTHCTVCGNLSRSEAGVDRDSRCMDSIVWGNERMTGEVSNWEPHWEGGSCFLTAFGNSCTTPSGHADLGGNVHADPRFVAAEAGDFRLLEISPCIAAASDGGNMGRWQGAGVVIPIPALALDAPGEIVSNTVAQTGYVDPAVAENIGTDAVRYCAFRTWATNGLKTTAVVLSARAYDSFSVGDLVAAPTLLADDAETKFLLSAPQLEADGTFAITVGLKDGAKAVPLAPVLNSFARRMWLGTASDALRPATAADILATASAGDGKSVIMSVRQPSPEVGFLRLVSAP